jgi:hypothetical protein
MKGGMKGMRLLCNRHAQALFNPAGGAPLSYKVKRPQTTLQLASSDESSGIENDASQERNQRSSRK